MAEPKALVRIGIDARLLSYREGGIAEYTRRLAEALPALDADNQYILFEGRHAPQNAIQTHGAVNFTTARLQTPPHHRLESFALGAELLPRRLDLLHSPDFIPPRFGARKFVVTVHDLNFLYYPQFQTKESRRYYAGQISRAVRQATHILADSESTKQDLVDKLAVTPEKVTVHMLGANPAYHPLPEEDINAVLRKHDLPRGCILHIGTFEPRKNLVGLFDAYALLRARYPDAPPLLAVGYRGWLYEPIFAKAAALGPQVIIREAFPAADLPALYNAASVLVLPSFYEGFGFPALEAMACGTPTVVSDRSSLPEVVGEVGLRIDPDRPESIADALYLALTDSEKRATWRQDGLARAATFTWQRTAQIALEVYRKVLNS